MNFNKFIDEFDDTNSYYLMGASKDAVLLIESFDILLPNTLKIKGIIDQDPSIIGSYSDLYEINSSSYKSKSKKYPKLIDIISFDEYLKKKDGKIILTSDLKFNEYSSLLKSKGLKFGKDFCNYKNIAAIWPHIYSNKTHLWRVDVLLTEKCSLKCTYCNMFMPHYQNPKDRDLNDIKRDLDLFFNKVDFVSVFHLVGGEPFLYPHTEEVF